MRASAKKFESWMKKAFENRIHKFGKKLLCYSPTAYPYKIDDHLQSSPHNFVSLAVTGGACALQCEHCHGKLLKGMESTPTPEALLQKCEELKKRGAEGVLISGGSDLEGHVPLQGFGDVLRIIKTDLRLQVVVHTGLVDETTVQLLKDVNIDAAMLDIIGDEVVAERIYHIANGPAKMEDSLSLLNEYGISTVPHVLVGLDYGKLGGELEALEMISHHSPAAVVVIVLSPIRKTPMENISPPSPIDVARVMTVARLSMESTPLLLGCARPIGEHKVKTDEYAVKSGVNGIAYISQEGVNLARKVGLQPIFMDICCSLAYQVLPDT
jgi:uncharacterized radical SAM superfamily protein